jgi:uncharacterized RDD family membrane protein YckC
MDDAQSTRPAGFWIRAVAVAIDAVVFMLVQVFLLRLARLLWGATPDGDDWLRPTAALFTLLFAAMYTTTLHAAGGQTIGKSLMGVRVVSDDGAPLTAGPALLRYAAYFLSAMPLGLGFVMAGLRRDRRALHDLIAGTRVERPAPRRRVARRAAAAARPPSGTLQDPAVSPAAESGPGA